MRFLLFVSLVLVVLSCKKVDPAEQAQIDDEIIQDYLETYEIVAEKLDNGLYYSVEKAGTGPQPTEYSDVLVAYTGYFTNQSVFDESEPEGISFNLQQVIKGWTKGIPLFKQGARGTLYIPSALGYGTSGAGSIPPNKVLIFDIHLIEVL
ncbi:FKBP-type peptidyl-prolyl cis-trans isomerase FkpA [Lishizhenia tianjinensis]|uniref:Peptidyl-prolyl cis-trans isomerase n=1 Tax=Lishizhenia tianjinensis TaxID=477690 RepID=A0A1I6XYE7_9FLAO|nr:FKBP-type peptidyl-prolyl cis-trans isomerase [Lishizhenia tianjinensis]SFT42951.1 FKBP-type peptidyl-prolyl cis-trans isomerase FkpA [Lishizhenia tianjinensis]